MRETGEHVRASRPWRSPDVLEPMKPPGTCDPPEVMALCLHCQRDDCGGDCEARRRAAGVLGPEGVGVKKGVRMEDVVVAYDAGAWQSLSELGRRFGVTKSTIRYWLKKAGKL